MRSSPPTVPRSSDGPRSTRRRVVRPDPARPSQPGAARAAATARAAAGGRPRRRGRRALPAATPGGHLRSRSSTVTSSPPIRSVVDDGMTHCGRGRVAARGLGRRPAGVLPACASGARRTTPSSSGSSTSATAATRRSSPPSASRSRSRTSFAGGAFTRVAVVTGMIEPGRRPPPTRAARPPAAVHARLTRGTRGAARPSGSPTSTSTDPRPGDRGRRPAPPAWG